MPLSAKNGLLNTSHLVVGLISSLLSCGVSLHWYTYRWGSGLSFRLRLWLVTRQLRHALQVAGVEEISRLEWTILILKLHSPAAADQIMALGQFYYLRDERVLDVLIQRLLAKPPVRSEAFGYLVSCLRRAVA